MAPIDLIQIYKICSIFIFANIINSVYLYIQQSKRETKNQWLTIVLKLHKLAVTALKLTKA